METEARIRFGTNLITFFDPTYWGLPAHLTYSEWTAAFASESRRYFDRMLDGVREAGLEGVELAPDPGGWEAALGAYGGVEGVRDALDDRGLTLTSSYAHGRQLIGNAMSDPAAEAIADDAFNRHARFLADLGGKYIVTGNIARSRFGNESPDDSATAKDFMQPVAPEVHEKFAEQLNRLGKITSRHGISIAIHTDAYSICSRATDIAQVLSLTDPQSIFLCPDAGHITLDGEDPVAVLEANIDRIPTMHWKDCAAPLSGHVIRGNQKERHAVMLTHFRVLGSGSIDWRSWMAVLRETRWSGWATEEIDNSPDPVGELRKGLTYFQEHLAPLHP